MARKYYNKLIRDKVPEQIERSGGEYEVRTLSPKEFRNELYRKLGEEAQEVITASVGSSRTALLEELADLEAVLTEIRSLEQVSDEEIRYVLARNVERKGGFAQRLYLIWSSYGNNDAGKK